MSVFRFAVMFACVMVVVLLCVGELRVVVACVWFVWGLSCFVVDVRLFVLCCCVCCVSCVCFVWCWLWFCFWFGDCLFDCGVCV